MTLGNMRANGVRSLAVQCVVCRHQSVLDVARWPDGVWVQAFASRVVCTSCGMIGADVRPNWQEQRPRESLTGAQWQR
jgi:hypothetical protein